MNRRDPTVAAFDVDGTLTRRDTMVPFLQRLCGVQRLARALGRRGLALSAVALGRVDRDVVKDAVLGDLLAGRDAAAVRAAGADYAMFLVSRGRLRPDTLARLRDHRSAGDRVVLVSASLDVYLKPLGERLGVDGVLCSTLEEGADGRLTGRLFGANCRGPEKVARLHTWFDAEGIPSPRLVAYGDSTGDRELLARADVGILVRPRRPLPNLDLT